MIYPPNKKWTQLNLGDIFGSIYISKNIDLVENFARLRLGKRLVLNTSSDDLAEITGVPVGFRYFSSAFYTALGNGTGYIFKATSIANSFTKVANGGSVSGAPTQISSDTDDIEIFSNKNDAPELCVSCAADQKVYYSTDGLTWSTVADVGGAGDAMMLCSYADRMYCTSGKRKIKSWDGDHTLVSPSATKPNANSYAVWLRDTNLVITFLRAVSDGIWIGTVNNSGGKGYMYKWDGQSPSVNTSYKLESSGALACTIKNDIPFIIDGYGKLLAFNGGTFKEVEGGKLNRINNKLLYSPFQRTNTRFIHPNGLALINGRISAAIDGTNYDVANHAGTQENTIPSGIWEYDENCGFYHKHSFSLSKSTGNIIDYGQVRIYGVGGLNEVITAQSPITTDGSFLAGCSYRTDSTKSLTGTKFGIFYDNFLDTLQKSGYVVTTKIETENVKQKWNKIIAFFKKFLSSTDKMIIKYQTEDTVSTEAPITWGDGADYFTTTTDISSYEVGDEIEVIQGKGSGICTHITKITDLGGGTSEVEIDESNSAITGADTALVRFDKWIKTEAYTSQDDDFHPFPIDSANSHYIKLKIYMVFTGRGEFNYLDLINNLGQKAQ